MQERGRVVKMMTLILHIGITMLSSIFIGGAIGYLIDKKFGTSTFLVFLIIGTIGGFRGVYKVIRQVIDPDTSEKTTVSGPEVKDIWEDEEEETDR